jgi:hypothetical protein
MTRAAHLHLYSDYGVPDRDIRRLTAPIHALMINGSLPLTRPAVDALMDYSASLPTGTPEGKVWKRRGPGGWWLGRYGAPYPPEHQYAGQIPIGWWPIYVEGQPAAFPRDVSVPPPVMRGRIVTPPPGDDEGDLCLRIDGRGETCLGSLIYLPDESLGGCQCPNGHPPCGYCTSTMPECRRCGWRHGE